MITKTIEVNGTEYRLTLTDQVINQVNNYKNLCASAYEDPESFEQLSSEMSDTIQEITSAAEPPADDSDLDGLVQEIIKVVENKAAEVEQELKEHASKTEAKSSRSGKKGSKSKK